MIAQLQAPPEEAEARALAAQEQASQSRDDGGSIFPLIVWGFVFLFIILPMLRKRGRGRRYGRSGLPIMIWGPGLGGGGGRWRRRRFGGFGGGGFGGGGGGFGGGGASGGW